MSLVVEAHPRDLPAPELDGARHERDHVEARLLPREDQDEPGSRLPRLVFARRVCIVVESLGSAHDSRLSRALHPTRRIPRRRVTPCRHRASRVDPTPTSIECRIRPQTTPGARPGLPSLRGGLDQANPCKRMLSPRSQLSRRHRSPRRVLMASPCWTRRSGQSAGRVRASQSSARLFAPRGPAPAPMSHVRPSEASAVTCRFVRIRAWRGVGGEVAERGFTDELREAHGEARLPVRQAHAG